MGGWTGTLTLGCCVLVALSVEASDGLTLEINVSSMVDSKPIPRAEVVIERLDLPTAPSVVAEDADDRVVTRAESNTGGKVVLRELPAIPLRISIRADGYVSTEIPELDKAIRNHRFDVVLPPAIELNGLIRDDLGKPLSGIEVRIPTVLTMNGREFRVAPPLSATTDAAGRFRMSGAPEGTGQFEVSAKGYTLLPHEASRGLGAQPIELTLLRTGTLQVLIDAPLHLRGQYTIRVERREALQAQTFKQAKRSADRGAITFPELPSGSYTVSASILPERVTDRPLTAIVDVNAGQSTEVELKRLD